VCSDNNHLKVFFFIPNMFCLYKNKSFICDTNPLSNSRLSSTTANVAVGCCREVALYWQFEPILPIICKKKTYLVFCFCFTCIQYWVNYIFYVFFKYIFVFFNDILSFYFTVILIYITHVLSILKSVVTWVHGNVLEEL
jgi:hypothetical protein